ncbi:alpha/beta hydrolase [Klebsiella sp. BIGb0407]|uniref:alpha/beta hydrolase n=1 Tax=Klebsiella sp. BIGb0407 TaxID=2940603 RepID=UPI00216853F0|nr:alpha/beta hydrolase [Klebsiella sp. BIGb0407]MCS3430666.1 acetyl esterase [Klebsiella sp. BIGb0407]
MKLEKGIAELVQGFIQSGRPSVRGQALEDRRQGYISSTVLAGEIENQVEVKDIELEGLILRIVSPLNATSPLPAVVYFHGGCFVSGGFATHDNQLRQLAKQGQCRVIAVQYRLAPEHLFPAAHDDAEKGANLVWKYADKLAIVRENITLAGDSAGGNLALVTALRLKAAQVWQPRQVILLYPMLDTSARFASYTQYGEDYIITRDTLVTGYELYLVPGDEQHPDASPLWRDDFNGLPYVHIITAQYDPLADEGEALYQRMLEQNVEVTHQRWSGVIHGFFQLAGVSLAAREVMRDVARRVNSPLI